jgi:hypothetical protein
MRSWTLVSSLSRINFLTSGKERYARSSTKIA